MSPPNFNLAGKVALVTGGNAGIGFAAAETLAAGGATIAIWGRREDRNEEAAERLRLYGQPVFSAAVDIANPEAVADGFRATLAALGRVDCLFANAGMARHMPSFLDITPDIRDEVFATNLIGTWNTLHAALHHMVNRSDPGGSIIVNGSLSALAGLPGGEHYGATKAALAAIVKGIASGYGQYGVRANMICPGYIEKDGVGARHSEKVIKRNPIPRYGRPDEMNGIIAYLASDASSFHTGDVITVDGGWMANALKAY